MGALCCVNPTETQRMSVGVLLLTHQAMGGALIAAAQHVLGKLPQTLQVLEVDPRADATLALRNAAASVRELENGEGVLVLTDLYGATPSNIGEHLRELGLHVRRVSGLNLPMLLRVLNYREQTLDELVQTAATGGRGGIFIDHA